MYECSLLKIFAGGSTSNRTNVENIVTIVSSRLRAVTVFSTRTAVPVLGSDIAWRQSLYEAQSVVIVKH